MNQYDWYVMNKDIEGEQCKILWLIYDIKLVPSQDLPYALIIWYASKTIYLYPDYG